MMRKKYRIKIKMIKEVIMDHEQESKEKAKEDLKRINKHKEGWELSHTSFFFYFIKISLNLLYILSLYSPVTSNEYSVWNYKVEII